MEKTRFIYELNNIFKKNSDEIKIITETRGEETVKSRNHHELTQSSNMPLSIIL